MAGKEKVAKITSTRVSDQERSYARKRILRKASSPEVQRAKYENGLA